MEFRVVSIKELNFEAKNFGGSNGKRLQIELEAYQYIGTDPYTLEAVVSGPEFANLSIGSLMSFGARELKAECHGDNNLASRDNFVSTGWILANPLRDKEDPRFSIWKANEEAAAITAATDQIALHAAHGINAVNCSDSGIRDSWSNATKRLADEIETLEAEAQTARLLADNGRTANKSRKKKKK